MGSGDSRLAFASRPPTVILLAGLQGSGKTTAAAKLALLLRKEGRKPGLVAADLQRPAAVDQLQQLGAQIDVPVYTGADDPVAVARDGVEQAKADGLDVVDPRHRRPSARRRGADGRARRRARRDQADERLARARLDDRPGCGAGRRGLRGAGRVRRRRPDQARRRRARRRRALGQGASPASRSSSSRSASALDQLEYFHPDRMASRILGMGDVLTLVEKAEAAVEEEDAKELEKRMMQGRVHLRRLPAQLQDAPAHGPAPGRAQADPGRRQRSTASTSVDERQLGRVEAIVLSMTPQERRFPHVIDGSRRKRIAAGSGTSVEQVNQLLEARKQMAKMMKQLGKGKMPALPGPASRAEWAARVRNQEAKEQAQEEDTEVDRLAVKLRLTRVGSKKNPVYRIVAADSRSPRDGKFLEIVGRYNPQTDPSTIEVNEERVKDWLSKGAQPSATVAKLLKIEGRMSVASSSSTSRGGCVDEPDAVRAEEIERDGDARDRAARRARRRRQGDRPPGPDRPGPAHGRARERRAARPARFPRDRGVARCESPRSTTSTATCRRWRRCWPRSSASRSTRSCSAATSSTARSRPRRSRGCAALGDRALGSAATATG